MFTCVGWKITLCDPIRQATTRSSEATCSGELYMRFYHNVYHRQYGSANSSTIVYDVLCKCSVNNLLFKHNVTIIDFIGAYTRAAWHNFASELFGT